LDLSKEKREKESLLTHSFLQRDGETQRPRKEVPLRGRPGKRVELRLGNSQKIKRQESKGGIMKVGAFFFLVRRWGSGKPFGVREWDKEGLF